MVFVSYTGAAVVEGAGVNLGTVSVTVVGLGPQCSQTVTLVVKPGGGAPGVWLPGQYVMVCVITEVTKPVGQMSTYEVVITVVMVVWALAVDVGKL